MAKMIALTKMKNGEEQNIGGRSREELEKENTELRLNQAAEFVDPKAIKTAEPFVSLWKIDEDLKQALVFSMKENGYDSKQPVIVWESTEKGLILLDGHTRRVASIEAGIDSIPVVYKKFDTEDEAFIYATSLQINRRNISDSDLFRFALKNEGKALPGVGKRAERIAKLFDVSVTKAKNLGTILIKASEEDKQAIINGLASINTIYQKIKEPEIKISDQGVNVDPLVEINSNTKKGSTLTPKENPLSSKRKEEAAINAIESFKAWSKTASLENKEIIKKTIEILSNCKLVTETEKNIIFKAFDEGVI